MTVFSKRTCFFYPLIRPFSLRYKGFHYGKILCVLFVYLVLETLEYSTASGLVIYQFCKAESANERSRHKKKKKKTEAQFSFSSWPNFDTHALLYNLQIAFDARICCTRQEPVSHDLKGCKIKFSVLKIKLKLFH